MSSNFSLMYKQTLFKQKLLMSTLVIVVVSSLIIIIIAVNPIHSAYSVNLTNPTDDVIRGSISSISNDRNSSTTWIITGVYKMENVKTSPTFNSTFYMIKIDGTNKHTHSIYDFKLNADPIALLLNSSR